MEELLTNVMLTESVDYYLHLAIESVLNNIK